MRLSSSCVRERKSSSCSASVTSFQPRTVEPSSQELDNLPEYVRFAQFRRNFYEGKVPSDIQDFELLLHHLSLHDAVQESNLYLRF